MQRILIVEDEQKTGRYLQQGLVEEGYPRGAVGYRSAASAPCHQWRAASLCR